MDKQCPTCGFTGQFDVCPNDQSVMESTDVSQDQDISMVVPANKNTPTDKEVVFDGHVSNGVPKLTGQILSGRYELIEILGVGGMGTVYRARQTSMNRFVAVKVLSPQFSQNPQMIRRFEKEARVVSKLSHPNTVSVFDYGQSDEALYLVMELLEGQTLKAFLRDHGPLKPAVAVHILTQIVRSLHQAHTVGIVHRDIKPANIFVLNINGDNQFAKVLDFGVAKLVQTSVDETVTQAGGIIGTPKYMAPEQAQAMEVDHRCDLYSVGILLFEMLAGHAPFDGDNPLGILMDHAQAPIPELPKPMEAKLNYGQLEYIAWRCLQKQPDDRYPNADALLTDIDHWQTTRPQVSEPVPAPRLSDHRPLDMSNNRPRGILMPLIIFILIGAAIYWQLERDNQPNAPQQMINTTAKTPTVEPNIKIDISSTPPADLIRVRDGKRLGRTPQAISIQSRTRFKLSRSGYTSQILELDTDSAPQQRFTLQSKKRPTPKTRQPTTDRRVPLSSETQTKDKAGLRIDISKPSIQRKTKPTKTTQELAPLELE